VRRLPARLRAWAWARVHWPLLAIAWGVSFVELAERFEATYGEWGGRACAFLIDYAIWLGWEAVNRISRRAGKIYAGLFMAVAVLISFAFQVNPGDSATFVPPGLLAGGVIAAYMLRPGREGVTDGPDTADTGSGASTGAGTGGLLSVGIPLPALPGPAALPAVRADAVAPREGAAEPAAETRAAETRAAETRAAETRADMDHAPGRAADTRRVGDPQPAAARPRGRAVATEADREAVCDMVRHGELPEGSVNLKRAAVVDRTAAADRATGGPGAGVTTRLAVELLREARERIAASNGNAGQPGSTEVMADA
jgi:hypothetical protein